MKNVLIWGTGKKARDIFMSLNKYCESYNITAFGDNDKERVGQTFCGRPIIDSEMLLEQNRQIDLIFISSSTRSARKEIREQLQRIVTIPIFDDINQLILQRISIDISGFCNARCRWCVTGRKNLGGDGIGKDQYMSYSTFTQLYENLISECIIVPDTEIMLYSWGEPLLNPDYVRIVEYLAEKRQVFSVSTNASLAPMVEKTDGYRNCAAFTFSISGFSQKSYDRIHQLRFDKIKENIEKIVDNLYACGFQGDGSLSWHVYKFNMHEMEAAREFAQSLNLRFNAYYPYFNGLSLTQKYLDGQLADEQEDIEHDFIFDHVEGLLGRRPENYRCYLEDVIAIDHKGRMVLCCASDEECKDYVWKPVTSLGEVWKLRKQMMQCDTCKICRKLHFDYWVSYNPEFGDSLCE